LTGRFNGRLGTAVLIFANEATWEGLITDPTITVEEKYRPNVTVLNCTHLVFASNNDWIVPVGIDDWRFVMFDVSEHRKGDKSYFKALGDEIGNDGIESLLHYLTNVNLSGFNPGVLPKSNSAAKFESKLKSTCEVTRWWHGFLRNGNGSPITVPDSAGSWQLMLYYYYFNSRYNIPLRLFLVIHP
jgi:hypothetical protein